MSSPAAFAPLRVQIHVQLLRDPWGSDWEECAYTLSWDSRISWELYADPPLPFYVVAAFSNWASQAWRDLVSEFPSARIENPRGRCLLSQSLGALPACSTRFAHEPTKARGLGLSKVQFRYTGFRALISRRPKPQRQKSEPWTVKPQPKRRSGVVHFVRFNPPKSPKARDLNLNRHLSSQYRHLNQYQYYFGGSLL